MTINLDQLQAQVDRVRPGANTAVQLQVDWHDLRELIAMARGRDGLAGLLREARMVINQCGSTPQRFMADGIIGRIDAALGKVEV